MNEELKQKAVEALLGLITDATKAKDFALEQAPDVVQQLLLYNFWASLIPFVISMILWLTLTYFLVTYLHKVCKANDFDGDTLWVLFLYSLAAIILVGTCSNNIGWFQIWLAPKVYLLEVPESI